MKTVCEKDQCTGCMACREICSKSAITIVDSMQAYNAVIDKEKCVNCNACTRICPNIVPPKMSAPISWKQGWTANWKTRKQSSSGGLATELASHFVQDGGIVCSCSFFNGIFSFQFATTLEEVDNFTGSKYVKSNPNGIYKSICTYLKEGKKVLFIGLPCQAAAVIKFVPDKLQNNLYIVDLICHGAPSPKTLEMFMQEQGIELRNVQDIAFRRNDSDRLSDDWQVIEKTGVYDKYSLAFLNRINFTEHCYNCDYARLDRVSDITLGDSWGSNLPSDQKEKGISLILCQTEKGKKLLTSANIQVYDVDLNNAVKNNHQLMEPSLRPQNYYKFFESLNRGDSFSSAVCKCLPRTCLNQDIKKVLIMLHGGHGEAYSISFLKK